MVSLSPAITETLFAIGAGALAQLDGLNPPHAIFGRTTVPGEHVLCVNPAALQRRGTAVHTILPSAPFAPDTVLGAAFGLMHLAQPHPATVWSSLPGSFSARCSAAGGAHLLQVRSRAAPTAEQRSQEIPPALQCLSGFLPGLPQEPRPDWRSG